MPGHYGLALEEFSGCCGISIICDFDEVLNEKQATHDLKLLETEHKYTAAGLILIALNEQQRKKWHRLLTKKSYKIIVNRFKNSRHINSKITLYGKRTPRAKLSPSRQEWW